MATHRYIGPTLTLATDKDHRDPLKHNEVGSLTGSQRGGLRSFVRERDRRGFWVVPAHLRSLTREVGVDE